jgi:hypothetical protein
MLVSTGQTAAHYRQQAAHIREFLVTVRDDDRLLAILVNVAARFERLADEADGNRRPRRAKRKVRPGGIIHVDSFSRAEGV